MTFYKIAALDSVSRDCYIKGSFVLLLFYFFDALDAC